MKLNDYIKQKKMTLQDFADKSGLSLATVWRYANGKYLPDLESVKKIRAATNNRVTEKDFIEW